MIEFFKKHLNIISKEERKRLEKEQIDSEIEKGERDLEVLSIELNSVKSKLTKDLQKAKNSDIENLINNKFNTYFQSYLEKATPITIKIKSLKVRRGEYSKKMSTASIIINNKGEILLLKRGPKEEFHPNTWSLPGGGIEFGKEGISESAYRELKEETGLEGINLNFEREVSLPKIDIFYFIGYLNDSSTQNKQYENIVLNYEEHSSYIWASSKMWNQMDLILDLKDHLKEILNQNIEPTFSVEEVPNQEIEESFKTIEKAFDKNKISKEVFLKAREQYLLKGGHLVGTERHWVDGTYKKVSNEGSNVWIKISDYSNHPKSKMKTGDRKSFDWELVFSGFSIDELKNICSNLEKLKEVRTSEQEAAFGFLNKKISSYKEPKEEILEKVEEISPIIQNTEELNLEEQTQIEIQEEPIEQEQKAEEIQVKSELSSKDIILELKTKGYSVKQIIDLLPNLIPVKDETK